MSEVIENFFQNWPEMHTPQTPKFIHSPGREMYIGGGGPFLCLGAPLAGVRVLDQQAPDPFILSGDPSRVRPCRLDLKLSVFQAFCGEGSVGTSDCARDGLCAADTSVVRR